MTDALDMFQAMRPPAPGMNNNDMRHGGDLHSLAMVPGSPSYRSRIPLPPCFQCGEDHAPGHDYGHPWQAEPVQPVHDEPVSASAIMRRPVPAVETTSSASPRRVALYVGRGDTYVVSVEEPPDWDAVETFRVPPALVVPLMDMARALEVKIQDKTGGDLLMLQQEAQDARREFTQNHDRGPTRLGDRESRRQEPAALRPEEDLSS